MSEELLKALMQLFAIVAKEDGITSEEEKVIESFLRQQLNEDSVVEYMTLLKQYAEETETSGEVKSEAQKIKARSRDSTRTLRICMKINKELTQKQKIVIMVRLFELVAADGVITEQEEEYVKTFADIFNIEKEEFEAIKEYVLSSEIFNKSIYNVYLENILIIDNKEKSLPEQKDGIKGTKKRKHIYAENLSGNIAVLRIPSVESYMVRYNGDSDIYLNGVALNHNQISVFATGSSLRSPKIHPIYYSDIISRFLSDDSRSSISFEAKKIVFTFPNGAIGLRNVSLSAKSGELVGIMGASGAGKSTLFNVLNGNDTPTKGEVLVNGINIHNDKRKVEGVVGYIPQDDLLIEELTVYQNLFYAAKLCFSHYSNKQIDELVTKTLSNLGLSETRNLQVGSPLQKTISGGQRKRLNIGLELLREPSLLFVDEPTSGLSSRDSENIMDLLKELSLRGKLVFVVIHQPSSSIFKMFDKLMILDVGGFPIYYGNPVEAVMYFKKMARQIGSEHGECLECGNVNPEQVFNIIETKIVDEYGRFTDQRKVAPSQWNEVYKENIKPQQIEESHDKPQGTLSQPNKFKQLQIFITRDVLSKISNIQYMTINSLEAPFLALLLAFIVRYFTIDEANTKGYIFSQNENLPAYIFMSIIVALFMGLTVSAEEIIRDRKILKREEFLNLSKNSYLFSKMTILFVLSAVQTISFVLVGNLILDIKGMTLTYWLALFSTACFANMLGLNISASFNSAVTIYILIPMLLIPQLLLSGVIVNFDKLHPSLASVEKVPIIGELMASRWAYEAITVSQYKDNEFEKRFFAYDKKLGMADFKKVYYIPELQSKLEYCTNHYEKSRKDIQEKVAKNLLLLKYEIGHEIEKGKEAGVYFTYIEYLHPDSFNLVVAENTKIFLDQLKGYYIRKYNQTSNERDSLNNSLISTLKGLHQYQQDRDNYQNEKIAEIVKNSLEMNRIIEKNGRLIQRTTPIYQDPLNVSGPLDFRAHFYAPRKQFFGNYYDTFWVNIFVIWAMSVILYITLYYDVLKRCMDFFEEIGKKIKWKK
ncbi:MAG: ATP-binding cassette domain-containing protein [Cytophagales bacterium]|nr:ATP-binding cassette domain-containing protein [Cytophagales bacterium]